MTPEEYARHKHSERQLAYYYAHHEKLKEYARKHNREYYAKRTERKKWMDRKKLVAALRCSASVHDKNEELQCENCPYYMVEEIPEKYRGLEDMEEGGKLFVKSCDVDQMAMDAADMLEADGERK